MSLEQVITSIPQESKWQNGVPLIVLTGGEPLEHPIDPLLLALHQQKSAGKILHTEIETSCISPPTGVMQRFAAAGSLRFNCSPKLTSSAAARIQDSQAYLSEYVAMGADFKFVVASSQDEAEVLKLIQLHGLLRECVWIMPEGKSSEQLRERSLRLADFCLSEGLRFTPRLHVNLWGARRGV